MKEFTKEQIEQLDRLYQDAYQLACDLTRSPDKESSLKENAEYIYGILDAAKEELFACDSADRVYYPFRDDADEVHDYEEPCAATCPSWYVCATDLQTGATFSVNVFPSEREAVDFAREQARHDAESAREASGYEDFGVKVYDNDFVVVDLRTDDIFTSYSVYHDAQKEAVE